MRCGSSGRAAPGRRAGAPLPRGRGPLDRPDRRPARPLAGDGQGVLLRPDRREGAGRQGPLRRRVPRLRRLHAAAQRQGRRLRVLQGLPSRRDRAALDPRSACSTRCASGATATDGCRPRTTGRARTRAGAAARRSSGWRSGDWPAASVVTSLFGTWAAARACARASRLRSSRRRAVTISGASRRPRHTWNSEAHRVAPGPGSGAATTAGPPEPMRREPATQRQQRSTSRPRIASSPTAMSRRSPRRRRRGSLRS